MVLDKRCGVVAKPDANAMSGRAYSEPRSTTLSSRGSDRDYLNKVERRSGWPLIKITTLRRSTVLQEHVRDQSKHQMSEPQDRFL